MAARRPMVCRCRPPFAAATSRPGSPPTSRPAPRLRAPAATACSWTDPVRPGGHRMSIEIGSDACVGADLPEGGLTRMYNRSRLVICALLAVLCASIAIGGFGKKEDASQGPRDQQTKELRRQK